MQATSGVGAASSRQRASLTTGPARAAEALLPYLGPAWFAFAFMTLAALLVRPINVYDEGIVLSHSSLVLWGQVPYRDFYTNYPPAIFDSVAGLWRLTGVSLLGARLLGLAFQVLLAVGAGRLAGRLSGRSFGWLSAGLVLAVMTHFGPTPRAYIAALAFAFAFCELLLQAGERGGWRWAAAGLLLGAVGCYRHDVFIYLVLALGPTALLWKPCGGKLPSPKEALTVVTASIAVLAVGWVPTLISAPWESMYEDLYKGMVEYVKPMRSLPITGLIGHWELWVVLAAPVLVGLALLFGPRTRAVLMAGVLSLLVLPAVSIRSSDSHVVYAIAPGLVLVPTLGAMFLERAFGPKVGRSLGVVACFLLVAINWHTPWPKHASDFRWTRLGGLHEDRGRVPRRSVEPRGRKELLAFIDANTQPGEPVYFGERDHSLTHCNEVDLYFLAGRPPPTRWLQFDPGLITRDDVQARVIEDMERTGLRIVVQHECEHPLEPNLSRFPDSTRLDEYIAEHFELVGRMGEYDVLERRSRSGSR